jgi:hypothetical protein
LRKIVFLVQGEFWLRGYGFAPWSSGLAEDAARLVGEGLLRVEEFSDPLYGFLQESPAKLLVASKALLERGRSVFESLRARDRLLAAELLRRVRSYSSVPITYLLA